MQPNRLSVGGVRSIEPVLHRRGQIATHDFVGCIMEFAVNGRPLEPSQALASRGILDRSVPACPPWSSGRPDCSPLAVGHLFQPPGRIKRRFSPSISRFLTHCRIPENFPVNGEDGSFNMQIFFLFSNVEKRRLQLIPPPSPRPTKPPPTAPSDCLIVGFVCLQMSETGRSLHRQPLQTRGHLFGPLVLAAVPVRGRLHRQIL